MLGLPCGSLIKNPAMQETWVRSLGQEGPLEKKMAAHSSILAREIPWTQEPGGPQSMESQKSWTRLSESKKKKTNRTNIAIVQEVNRLS